MPKNIKVKRIRKENSFLNPFLFNNILHCTQIYKKILCKNNWRSMITTLNFLKSIE